VTDKAAPAEAPAVAATRELLRKKIDVDFQVTSVANGLHYLSEIIGGLKVEIDPQLAAAGIDLKSRSVSVTAKEAPVENIIRSALGADLGFRIQTDGSVLITTRAKAELPALPPASADLAAQVEALVAQLGAKEARQREEAQKKLADLARSADITALLKKHVDDPDPEIRARVRRALEATAAASPVRSDSPMAAQLEMLKALLEKAVAEGADPAKIDTLKRAIAEVAEAEAVLRAQEASKRAAEADRREAEAKAAAAKL
jgi:hypothetical protein